jgi:hypothetical protein
MGGIYTLGKSEGSVVRDNVFHHIYAFSYGGWGLYTDEGSTGILFEDNLVYATKTGSFHQHYGRENIVRNNILVDSLQHQLQVTRVEEHLSFTFENNIVYWTNNSPALAGPWEKNRNTTRNNVYWSAGRDVTFAGKSLTDWQALGREEGSVVADPLFVDAANLDFRLKPESPALKLGFKPFDFSKAGVYGDAAWIARAKSVTYPPMEAPPEPPPLPIKDGFERTAAGQKPTGCEVHVEGKGDSIVVTEETASSGRRCVKVTDAAGLKNAWNPHLSYKVSYSEGTVQNRFDLRIEQASQITFEWRDWSQPEYQTGPMFTIRDAVLQAGGRAIPLPLDEWIGFEIAAELGQPDGGRWTLRLTMPGKAAQEFGGLSFVRGSFKKLTWVGFTSNATGPTSFFLDNFSLGTR